MPVESKNGILIHVFSDLMEDIMSPDEGTCSSRMSTKSEKNMADFEGEESGCEEELIQLTGVQVHLASPHHINKMASLYCSQVQNTGKGNKLCFYIVQLIMNLLESEIKVVYGWLSRHKYWSTKGGWNIHQPMSGYRKCLQAGTDIIMGHTSR